ncbi:DUF7546 family protein [Salinibaculum salinum]|uniref:DUF7546 family protein n=1 Tax=Salinibaculum salinum TaxID=3131996 RepID=UPI0030EDD998
MSTIDVGKRLRPDGETLAWLALVFTTEFLIVAAYVLVFDVAIRDWTLFVVPFVWINVAGWAIYHTTPAPSLARRRRIAGAIAGGYFLLLSYFGGIFAVHSHDHGPVGGFTVDFVGLPPGWSPSLLYTGEMVHLVFLPYKVIGYIALAYLVYKTALDASSAIFGGLVGIFSCVSCSFPLIAGIVTGVVGGGSALAAATAQSSYLLSTVVFVITVGLLYWQPSIRGVVSR